MSATEIDRAEAPAPSGRLVWDLPLRLFHWGLAASIVTAFVSNKLGVAYFRVHELAGYAALVLIGFRVFWGFVGPKNARFGNFLRGPRAVIGYGRKIFVPDGPHYAGHNPLGALMVLALLAGGFFQGLTGLFANDEIFNAGPLAGLVAKGQSLWLTSIHRRFFYVLLAAVAVHVGAVLAHKIFKGENLVAAMITGRKPAELAGPEDEIASSRPWLALGLLALAIAALAAVLTLAPVGAVDTDF